MNNLGIIDLMAPAFAECVVLVGIHSYLGLHVIRRKVIFVDLALAQVAALGTTVGFLFGMAPDSTAALLFSMVFTFIGAAVFSITRLRGEKIPQEAIIGLVYALAAAVVVLVVDRAPHGAEHIKEVMTGAILWVRWETIGFSAAVYLAVGLFHWIFRRQFLLISRDPETAYSHGLNVRFWDFLFYLSFGVVISISVQTAGVLLVFVFLVVPAIAATLITNVLRTQLFIGWISGTLVTVVGLMLSYWGDMPSGPTVVSVYGAALVVLALGLFAARAVNRKRALARLGLGMGAATAIGVAIVGLGTVLGNSSLAAGRLHPGEHAAAHRHHHPSNGAVESPGVPATGAVLESELLQRDEAGRASLLASFDAGHQQPLLDAFQYSRNDLVRLAIARHLADHAPRGGACLFADVLYSADSPFLRFEVLVTLERLAGREFGIDSDYSLARQQEETAKLEAWLVTVGCSGRQE